MSAKGEQIDYGLSVTGMKNTKKPVKIIFPKLMMEKWLYFE